MPASPLLSRLGPVAGMLTIVVGCREAATAGASSTSTSAAEPDTGMPGTEHGGDSSSPTSADTSAAGSSAGVTSGTSAAGESDTGGTATFSHEVQIWVANSGFSSNGADVTDEERSKFARLFKRIRHGYDACPDILLVQEIRTAAAASFIREDIDARFAGTECVADDAAYAVTWQSPPTAHANKTAVLHRAMRFERTDQQLYLMKLQDGGGACTQDNMYVQIVQLEEKDTGVRFSLVSLHSDKSTSQACIDHNLSALRDVMPAGEIAIIAGDFNERVDAHKFFVDDPAACDGHVDAYPVGTGECTWKDESDPASWYSAWPAAWVDAVALHAVGTDEDGIPEICRAWTHGVIDGEEDDCVHGNARIDYLWTDASPDAVRSAHVDRGYIDGCANPENCRYSDHRALVVALGYDP